jgi:hypothetical protein
MYFFFVDFFKQNSKSISLNPKIFKKTCYFYHQTRPQKSPIKVFSNKQTTLFTTKKNLIECRDNNNDVFLELVREESFKGNLIVE